jgi:quercetin 2,3-dioxygenase
MPRGDGEQATPAQKGAMHASHGQPAGVPRGDGEQATPAQKELDRMLEVRRSLDRGYADHGWLKSYHTFSFADYYDPVFEDFGPLRVINEDRIKPGKGYDNQAHHDVEILTYVLAGALEHKDSLGNAAVIRPGDVQRLSAGAGVTQSELNPSTSREVHLLQIWIKPSADGLEPGYEQKRFTASEKRGRLRLVASPTGEDGSVRIQQDARVYTGLFNAAERTEFDVGKGRRAYAHVASGSIAVNETRLNAGDGVKITKAGRFALQSGRDAEVLMFDLP